MKPCCLFILIFYLVLTIQYARSETYKDWYEKYARNCTVGSMVKSSKANMVCICSMPGVIESCKYIGSVKESSAAVLRLPAWNPRVGMSSVNGHQIGREIDFNKPGSAKSALLKEVRSNKKKLYSYSLKGKAQACKTGDKFKEPYGCNWCNCIEDGVVVCGTNTCH